MIEQLTRVGHIAAMHLYGAALLLADRAFGHPRARAWRAMRRQAGLSEWADARPPGSVVWFHCASLGEYEQARPVMAAVRRSHPQFAFLLTFFSPSGHEPLTRKKPDFWRHESDWLSALPLDTPRSVRPFMAALDGRIALFATVKYEVWPVLLKALGPVPKAIFAAHIPSGHWLTRRWATGYRATWRRFDAVLVQTQDSVLRLAACGISGAEAMGDPRADRVLDIASTAPSFPGLQAWRAGHFTVVAGSTWPAEETALLADPPERLVLVPHDLSANHLGQIKQQLLARRREHLFTSAAGGAAVVAPNDDVQVVVVDEMGWLAGLYALADAAVVGGGWGVGIHNTLEPAAHGVPVVTGPNISRFQEALGLRDNGALRVAQQPEDLRREWEAFAPAAGDQAKAFVLSSRGSAERIAKRLEQIM